MNSFFCWLTGGHRYADKNLKTYYSPDTRESTVFNHCVKCGIGFLFEMNTDALVKRDMEEYAKRRRLYVREDESE
jgi:hypothetical protein